MPPAFVWDDNCLKLLDQRKLPGKEVYICCRNYVQVAEAVEKMIVRGAPIIGIAAAYGIVLGVLAIGREKPEELKARFDKIYQRLARTRPTARNLFWALERMKSVFNQNCGLGLNKLKKALLKEAREIAREDARVNRLIGQYGQRLFRNGWAVLTHCNTGALATAAYGTALGVIRTAAARGKKICVYATETRPVLQGARLTVWELARDKIPVVLITDNMAGWLMRRGEVQAVIVGADRIARNGDTANKIGTYSLAVLARENRIPFYVAAPFSTIDLSIKSGDEIPIEERSSQEVREIAGRLITLPDVPVRNPGFDITPSEYISAIITEKGLFRYPYEFV